MLLIRACGGPKRCKTRRVDGDWSYNVGPPPRFAIYQTPVNMEIFGEGEPAEYLYEVVRGLVRHCKISGDGRRQVTTFHMPGEVFGLEPDDEHHFSAEAVTDSIILAVKRRAIMRLAACDLYFAHQLWTVTAQDHQRIRKPYLGSGLYEARQRVAAFLLLMIERSPGDDEIELSMLWQDIADYLV
jgi:CRP/FNR family transcriptional regulator, nitrogen fixation regulation protein